MSSLLSVCPVCHSEELTDILQMDGCPIHCNVLLADAAAARNVPRANIHLAFCNGCSHIFNRAFRPELLDYDEGYENSLYFSPTFRRYAAELVEDLSARFDLRKKTIVEIGSGDGQFLKALCERGRNRGFGFDPSAPARTTDAGVEFISDLYSEHYEQTQADFVCCRHVLEHIGDPHRFLRTVRATLGQARDAGLYFEVPNSAFLIESGSIWDFIYAHFSYFSAFSLGHLWQSAGFQVESIQ